MIRERSELDAIASEIHVSGQPIALDLETYTDTGRFSSSEPNMQNITRRELRTAFVASVGNVLAIADYSQIELRAAAYFSGDKRMIEAFIKGEDLHTKTASIVLGKSEKEITKEDRKLAKALNYGFLYGQSAEGFVRYAKTSYGVKMTDKQAATLLFLAALPDQER
jgi:DNA polymerase-1